MEPFFADILDRLLELHREFAQALSVLPQLALDWAPGKEMNSLNVLVAHTAGSERYWIGEIAGGQPVERDRDAEFRTAGLDASALQGLLTASETVAQQVLAGLSLAELEEPRTGRDGRRLTVGWALAHALEHTGIHLGHAQLVRQLWGQYADVPSWLNKVEPAVTLASVLSLREVTKENFFAICKLSNAMSPLQKHMVATNGVSIAEAHLFPDLKYWAIYADETPVGFMMLHDTLEDPGYFLWRFMIAAPYQKMGFGRRAIELLVEYVKGRPGATVLGTSCGTELGSPEGFYRRMGFEPTGRWYDDEKGLSKTLS